MEELPNEKTLVELVEMGKSFEDSVRFSPGCPIRAKSAPTRKLYEMAEAFAQKYEKRLHKASLAEEQKKGIHETQAPAGCSC